MALPSTSVGIVCMSIDLFDFAVTVANCVIVTVTVLVEHVDAAPVEVEVTVDAFKSVQIALK